MVLSEANEDYLEAILILYQKKGSVRSIDLVHHFDYSRPTIFSAVKRLREGGYLTVKEDKHIELTASGRAIAEKIYERHRFLMSCLVSLGVDFAQAEKDACKIEHDLSDKTYNLLRDCCREKGTR